MGHYYDCPTCGEEKGASGCACTRAAKHKFYTAADFTDEEYDRRNQIAVMVIDGGLQICKKCGAAEGDLTEYNTCDKFRKRPREN